MASSSCTLFPGYTQVVAFGPDDEYLSEDEEVVYVTLDLGPIEPTLVPNSATYRLIGLDSPTPFLQLSGTILKGRHEPLLGSELLFAESTTGTDAKKSVAHLGTTSHRIRFSPVELVPKSASPSPDPSSHADADASTSGPAGPVGPRGGTKSTVPAMPPLATPSGAGAAAYASLGLRSAAGPGGGRGRGRPKGAKARLHEQRVLAQSLAQMVGAAPLDELPRQRRRKKSVAEDGDDGGEEGAEDGAQEGAREGTQDVAQALKKKRGRPRKKPAEEEEEEEGDFDDDDDGAHAGPSTAAPDGAPLRRSGRERRAVQRPEFTWEDLEMQGAEGADPTTTAREEPEEGDVDADGDYDGMDIDGS